MPEHLGLIAIATLECFIGICLLAGKWMRVAVWLLATEFVGILSPIVLLPARLFAGPHHAPTLEGQYVLKDVIFAAAALVVTAATFRGGRLIRDEPQPGPTATTDGDRTLAPEQKLQIVLQGARDAGAVPAVCAEHAISEADYYRWRDQTLEGATRNLADHELQPSPLRP